MKHARALRRHKSHLIIRKKVKGTKERPRLTLFRGNKNMFSQIIDDQIGHTLAAASSASLEGNNIATAASFGAFFGQKALEKGIKQVVFDRGGRAYHGRVKAFADGVRQQGIEF